MKKHNTLQLMAVTMVLMLAACTKTLDQSNRMPPISTIPLGQIPPLFQVSSEVSKKVKIANPIAGGDSLLAWLFVPATAVKVPGVVVLHGSGGLWTNTNHEQMATQFTKWITVFRNNKMAALFVDSYVARGIPDNFTTNTVPANFNVSGEFIRPRDAYKGLEYLRVQPNVSDSKIGFLGYSHGSATVASTMVDSSSVAKTTGCTVYNSSKKLLIRRLMG